MVATTLPAGTRTRHQTGRRAIELAAGLALVATAFVAGRATVDDSPADRSNPVVTSQVGEADPALTTCHVGTPC